MRSDAKLLDHILNHIDNGTTNLGDGDWFEPVENYTSQIRFDAERRLMPSTTCSFLSGCSFA